MARRESQAADLGRLSKVLARLDSDQEAEILAAAKTASRLLRVADLSWEEVIVTIQAKGWRRFFSLGQRLVEETRRRIAAERAARHWRILARQREGGMRTCFTASSPCLPGEAAKGYPRPVSDSIAIAPSGRRMGEPRIDRLLNASALSGQQRIRVEAIACWYRQTGGLLDHEEQELESFCRQLDCKRQDRKSRPVA